MWKGGPIVWTNSVTISHKMLHEYTGSQYVSPIKCNLTCTCNQVITSKWTSQSNYASTHNLIQTWFWVQWWIKSFFFYWHRLLPLNSRNAECMLNSFRFFWTNIHPWLTMMQMTIRCSNGDNVDDIDDVDDDDDDNKMVPQWWCWQRRWCWRWCRWQ